VGLASKVMTLSLKRILVIGANGFTGRHVFRALENDPDFLPVNSHNHGVDITKVETFRKAVLDINPSAIINLAAISTLDEDNIPLIYDMNSHSIVRMLDCLKQLNFAGRFINASSALVYGQNTPKPILETQTLNPGQHYSVSKAMADQCMVLYRSSIDAIVVRPFNCIGLGHKPSFVVPKIVAHFRKKETEIVLGNTEIQRDFVDIRDVANMYVAALRADNPPNIINFCSGKATSLDVIIQTLKRVTNHEMDVRFDQAFARSVDNLYMCGDNSRLKSLPFEYSYSLENTLSWMLDEG